MSNDKQLKVKKSVLETQLKVAKKKEKKYDRNSLNLQEKIVMEKKKKRLKLQRV